MDIIRSIQDFNAGREPERLRIKFRKMRANAFSFLRGTSHLFLEHLEQKVGALPAPLTCTCGDLHLENFGSFRSADRLTHFDINDFDDAAVAPASLDLLRLLSSLHVGAQSMACTTDDIHALCTGFVDTYVAALASGTPSSLTAETATGTVRLLFEKARTRKRTELLDTRTRVKGKKRVLRIDGKKTLEVSDKQRKRISDLMAQVASGQEDPEFFKVIDIARRVAGTGSLGIERFEILVRGKGSPDGNTLLDLKGAVPSPLVAHVKNVQPAWQSEAHRVVGLQRRMQAACAAFLQPVKVEKTSFVLRELQPSSDRVTLEHSAPTRKDLENLSFTLAQVLAWAQLRGAGSLGTGSAEELMAFALRKPWRKNLMHLSAQCTLQIHADAASFNAAYDSGTFKF
jgi:uncharacterized protein (DUF2252 family)